MLTRVYRLCRTLIAACAMIAVMLIALSISFQFFRSSKPQPAAAEPAHQTTTGTFTPEEEPADHPNHAQGASPTPEATPPSTPLQQPTNAVEHQAPPKKKAKPADAAFASHQQEHEDEPLAPKSAADARRQTVQQTPQPSKPDAWGAIARFDNGTNASNEQHQGQGSHDESTKENTAQRTLKRLMNDF